MAERRRIGGWAAEGHGVPRGILVVSRSSHPGASAGARGPAADSAILQATPIARAGPATFARISRLLEELRDHPLLREPRSGVFYLESREILHFHDNPSGVWADLRLGGEIVRLPVTSRSEQLELLGRIEDSLSAMERTAADLRRRPSRRKRRS